MSLYCEIETEIHREQDLVLALEAMGFKGKVEVHARGTRLEGFEGDPREQIAHVVIRREHLQHQANDLGFARTRNGRFTLMVSEYDRATKFGDAWLNRVKGHYLEQCARRDYTLKGYRLKGKDVQRSGNKVVLTFSR